MFGRATKRLPGVRFEAQSPALPEVLPRMDIAVFVGFAASGPLHIPVALESASQFTAIFGGDTSLAWDKRQGEMLQAYLAPAVRAFFRNGGRRCWVVRVARDKVTSDNPLNRARSNFFPIPGLARASFATDGATLKAITPAFARARSEGSWSDGVRVSAAIETRPVRLASEVQKVGDDYVFEIEVTSTDELAPGDLLRLAFKNSNEILMLVVTATEPATVSPTSRRRYRKVKAHQPLRFEPFLHDSSPASPLEAGIPVTATIYTSEITGSPVVAVESENSADLIDGFSRQCTATLRAPHGANDRNRTIELSLQSVSLVDAPAPGSLVKVEDAGCELWLIVAEQRVSGDGNVNLRGEAMRRIESSAPMPSKVQLCERLSFELRARLEGKINSSIPGLTFVENHDRSWTRSLPSDSQLFGAVEGTQGAVLISQSRGMDLGRFPLAGFGAPGDVFFPLGMPALHEHDLGAIRLAGTELERDGLAEFDAALFLDEGLADTQHEGLLSQADFIRYLSPRPRELRGIHTALGIEEATLIAVPDAVHRGWTKYSSKEAESPVPSLPPLRPDWWHFLPCRSLPGDEPRKLRECEPSPAPTAEELRGIRPVHEPLWENFLDCSIRVIEPPTLSVDKNTTRTGIFTLFWISSPAGPELEYEVEEASTPNFTYAETIYSGTATQLPIVGRQMGNYYYRVKAICGRNFSDWSNGVVVQVASVTQWETIEKLDYDATHLLMLQRSVMRMCAARGDLFAVFSLPHHFREAETLAHLSTLRGKSTETTLNGESFLGFLDQRTLSFGGIWHPWLSGREENRPGDIRSTPPCGAITGVIAKRALGRGAWVAPANEPISEIVTLVPRVQREEWLNLQEAKLNLIRQEPRGFLSLSSDTLSDDPDLRQINVRRLLSLLRRLALKHGATYVFEPNSHLFQRAVKRGFELFLNRMFTRGAFAGATASTSYQVVVDESLNTPRSMEQGRFIVELRVAPSLPLRFLTVRLVQTGDRGFVQEV